MGTEFSHQNDKHESIENVIAFIKFFWQAFITSFKLTDYDASFNSKKFKTFLEKTYQISIQLVPSLQHQINVVEHHVQSFLVSLRSTALATVSQFRDKYFRNIVYFISCLLNRIEGKLSAFCKFQSTILMSTTYTRTMSCSVLQ